MRRPPWPHAADNVCVWIFVCVCVRERERERENGCRCSILMNVPFFYCLLWSIVPKPSLSLSLFQVGGPAHRSRKLAMGDRIIAVSQNYTI